MSERKIPDSIVVERVLSGDISYFDLIVSKYKDMVFSVAIHTVYDEYLAEDIAQETFLDCYLGLSGLREPEKLGSWLYGIAKRKSLRVLSRKKLYSNIDEYSETLADFSDTPEDGLLKKETVASVRKAMDVLSEKNREIVEMYYFHDMKIRDIARGLQLPSGTVKSRLYEARNKLKGELNAMKTGHTLPSDFEEKVKKALHELRYYQAIHGGSKEGYREIADKAKQIAEKIPDENRRNKALSDVLYYTTWYDEVNEAALGEAQQTAEECGNADVICALLVNEILAKNDYTKWITLIEEKAIPKMNELKSDSGKGILLFWKARAYFGLDELDKAYDCMCEAARLIDAADNYHACAVSGKKALAFIKENADTANDGVRITSETLLKDGGKVIFASQPGFSAYANTLFRLHKHDSFHYFMSQNSRMLFDSSMKIGEKVFDSNTGSVLEIVSYAESISVPAGRFDACMHVRLVVKGEYTADSYFADHVGLVKVTFTADDTVEGYELCRYEIRGGSGYMPFCVGNKWVYDNPDLPDYICRMYENEIDWTDGVSAHYSVVSVATVKKNYQNECALDGDMYIMEADRNCTEWKLDKAIENLKSAVRCNSTEEATVTALAGIEYLKRFQAAYDKGFRICPSAYKTSHLLFSSEENCMRYEEAVYTFGPYRYGTRFKENRIFGIKPLRYLQLVTGKVFDYENWKDGYRAEFAGAYRSEAKVTLSVDGVESVKTGIGVFTDCIKVTIVAEMDHADSAYYFKGYRYTDCGKKEFYFAKGIGLVKFDFTWGDALTSSAELASYDLPASEEDSYFPVQIGNRWEYDEMHLTDEGYTARLSLKVCFGRNNRYVLSDSQEFWFNNTEKEYNRFKERISE